LTTDTAFNIVEAMKKQLTDIQKIEWKHYNDHRSKLTKGLSEEEVYLFNLSSTCSLISFIFCVIIFITDMQRSVFIDYSLVSCLLCCLLLFLHTKACINLYEKDILIWDENYSSTKENHESESILKKRKSVDELTNIFNYSFVLFSFLSLLFLSIHVIRLPLF